jgi:general secretion pathway protein A
LRRVLPETFKEIAQAALEGRNSNRRARQLIRDLAGQVSVGLISNTHARVHSMHSWALSALSFMPADPSDIAVYEALVEFSVREYGSGIRTLLVVDEAQGLPVGVLEELRVLSNVNSENDLVLQVLHVGQPELRATPPAAGCARGLFVRRSKLQ